MDSPVFILNVIHEIIGSIHWQSWATSIFLFTSYILFSSLLQYYFYWYQRDHPETWKTEPKKIENLQSSSSWWLPAVSFWSSKKRAPWHAVLATLNLSVSAICGGFVTEMIIRGKSKLYFSFAEQPLWWSILGMFAPHIYQGVLEYYWHVALHWGPLYRIFHKFHHHYKNPEPFDDMYIHPLEAFGYYCILFSPPLALPMHLYSYLLYMVVCGITGVLDHCGVRFRIPNIYDTADHDAHHSKFKCNYAFPFPLMDIIHGTYYGELNLFGKSIKFRPKGWQSKSS